jgi:hypothetical protein
MNHLNPDSHLVAGASELDFYLFMPVKLACDHEDERNKQPLPSRYNR